MNESKKKDRYEDAKKFVRYSDGAKMYSMGMTKFQEVAKDAKACYKIGQLVLVNTEILDNHKQSVRYLCICNSFWAIKYGKYANQQRYCPQTGICAFAGSWNDKSTTKKNALPRGNEH